MRKLFFTLLVSLLGFLSFAPIVQAQGPTPTPDENNSFGQLRETDVVSMPSFDFTPVTIITPTQTLSITIGIDEINTIGQMVTSVFALLDQYSILPTMLIVVLALFALRWCYGFVVGRPGRGNSFNVSGAIDEYYDFQDSRLEQNFSGEELDDLLGDNRDRRKRARSVVRYFRR